MMVRRSYGFKSMDFAHFIWFGRSAIVAYGKRTSRMPKRDATPEPALLTQAIDSMKERGLLGPTVNDRSGRAGSSGPDDAALGA